jgi:hypothetical protein
VKEKIAHFFWPPLRANRTNRLILDRRQQQGEAALWAMMHQEVSDALTKYKDLSVSCDAASKLAQSEASRKDTLESKASVIVQSGGIAVSIVALAPAVGRHWTLSFWWTTAVLALYFLSILHLLVAVYYAVQARRVGAYAMPSADGLTDSMKESSPETLEKNLIAKKIADTKWNEDALTMKVNQLSVAEDMLLRGLAFFAASASVAILRTASLYLERHIL